MQRRGATESELRDAQMRAIEAARQGAEQGRHRSAVANAASEAARAIITSAGFLPPPWQTVPVIINETVYGVANAASEAAHAAMKASNGNPSIVADEVRRATDMAIDFAIRGI